VAAPRSPSRSRSRASQPGCSRAHRSKGEFGERDLAVFRSLASQLSIAVENARLYRQIEGLFRQYMSPDVAASLLADPNQASLGGTIREVTVLMADLRGFTPFSERSSPDQVVAMLNRYFGIAVPVVLEEGGTVVQFVGDAMMALFNAPTRQPDHALRAARAGLALQHRIGAEAAEHPEWPRFRVGINSGPALVGNIGSDEFRNFTAIGDTTNLAARLEATADVGQVVISGTTCALLGEAAIADSLGPLHLKGKVAPVEAFVLQSLRP
jgi:class 3 adenylate cyclase